VTSFVIRDAVTDDMTALSGVYRRSSLSNEGDRPNLLAHPETLEFSDLAVREGRTRGQGGMVMPTAASGPLPSASAAAWCQIARSWGGRISVGQSGGG
jgi:hypothetical protein